MDHAHCLPYPFPCRDTECRRIPPELCSDSRLPAARLGSNRFDMNARNQQRIAGGCAVFMLIVSYSYSPQVKMFCVQWMAGWQSFWQFVSHPWTQALCFPLAIIALPLAVAFLVSARRFYWGVVGWMAAYFATMLASFIGEAWDLCHPFAPTPMRFSLHTWVALLSPWGWLVIPHFVSLCGTLLLLILLLRSRDLRRRTVA